MNAGSFLRILLFASMYWVAASTTLSFQTEKNSNVPILQPFRLTLSINHETYTRIADLPEDAKKPHAQLVLDLRLRFTNQTDKVVKLDTNCILWSETVIYDSPLVGPSEPLGASAPTAHALTDQACPYTAEEKLLRLLPGESFEATQRVKFRVVSPEAFDPPDTLKPGKYFLKLTETTMWEIDGEDLSLREKWKQPGVQIGRAVTSKLMSFVVKGKQIKRQV